MSREGVREKVVSASLAVARGLGMVCTNHIAKLSLAEAGACLWNPRLSVIGVHCSLTGGIPGCAHGKESARQCRRHEIWVRSLGREDPLEEEMAPTPVFLPGESHGQRSLAGYHPWGCKESDPTEAT